MPLSLIVVYLDLFQFFYGFEIGFVEIAVDDEDICITVIPV